MSPGHSFYGVRDKYFTGASPGVSGGAGLFRHLPEKCLHVDDGFGVCHVVFLGTHGAFLVHDHHVGSKSHPTPEQVV